MSNLTCSACKFGVRANVADKRIDLSFDYGEWRARCRDDKITDPALCKFLAPLILALLSESEGQAPRKERG